MSLYNLMHGTNPLAPMLLAIIGHAPDEVPRFRDCYWKDGEICVYTRTGGGNRETYEDENDAMSDWAGYLRDEDDDFESTYATFYFSLPAQFEHLRGWLDGNEKAETPAQSWGRMIERLKSADADDPLVKRTMELFGPMLAQIQAAITSVDGTAPVPQAAA